MLKIFLKKLGVEVVLRVEVAVMGGVGVGVGVGPGVGVWGYGLPPFFLRSSSGVGYKFFFQFLYILFQKSHREIDDILLIFIDN